MRIKELDLDITDIENTGLKEFFSTKFNPVIALVGKNGSGKSRYLKAIEKKILTCDSRTDLKKKFEFLPDNLTKYFNIYVSNQPLYDAYMEFELAQKELALNPNDKILKNKANHYGANYSSLSARSPADINAFIRNNNLIKAELQKRIKIISSDDLRKLQASFDFKLDKTSFQDIIDSTVDNLDVNEFQMISESALTYLQRLPHKLSYDDIDCRGDEKKFKSRVSYKRYKLLSDLLQDFLGKELLWHSRTSNVDEYDDHINIKTTGYWTINNREFNYLDFSDGEKVLFTYAILLFLLSTNPKTKFKESIIIIDEPELNLHPKAQIKLIQSLENLIKDEGQLIIATHSLSIIANLNYGSIFLVREGQLSTPSSSVPFSAIDELMGFEEHYNKIVEFLVSTPSWAMTNFMAQCFEDPEVFESASKDDPQLDIFKELILKKKSLSVLDFGSGMGRLIDRIKENSQTWNRINKYDCFDVNEDFNDLVISKGAANIFNNLKDIPNETYDLIIIVNVLHEIHIEYWGETFLTLKKALKPNGFIAVIEDVELPIGELPNGLGFLLLEKEEMKILLGNKITFINSKIDRYKDRIICGLIRKEDMNTVNKSKLITCLEKLKENSLKDIIRYRAIKEKRLNIGRLYALKANTYVNSQLALDYLNKDNRVILNLQKPII